MTFALGPALLFCPADRPDRFAKAAERADAVILDLEDAVAAENKQRARDAILAQLDGAPAVPTLDPARTIIRINPPGTSDYEQDLRLLAQTPYRTVMLAKAGHPDHVRSLADFTVIALCETAAGVVNAAAIAAEPNVSALMWGAEDLLASLGGTSSRRPDGSYRAVASHARSTVLLAAGAAGKKSIDSVYVDIADLDGLGEEALDAVASGFVAKACIHPGQVAAVRAAFAPSQEEVAHAREVLAAAESSGSGVFRHRGKMIDGPILRHAEELLRRAGQP